MKKSNIIHIHTDNKFIHNVNRFECEEFENTIIIVGKKRKYNGVYKDSVKYYSYSRIDLLKVINLCKSAKLVVLYDLDFTKAYIANRLPKSVIVAWRFFGGELYIKIPKYVYSDKTLRILDEERKEQQNLYLSLKLGLRNSLIIIKYRAIRTKEIDTAMFSRIDYFLGLFKIEHEFFKTIWPHLPPFVQYNMNPYLGSNTTRKSKSNLIILGNNRSPFNNHLEILEAIQESKGKSKFDFLLLFNYGRINRYTNTVRKKASQIKEVKILEEFLSVEEFKELYKNADAFVLNGHRQMAMGNILEALHQNIKIYLNEKNLIYSWLKENGLFVFTMDDFFSDLDEDNIALSHEHAIINQEQLGKLTTKYNKQAFQKAIIEIIEDGYSRVDSNR